MRKGHFCPSVCLSVRQCLLSAQRLPDLEIRASKRVNVVAMCHQSVKSSFIEKPGSVCFESLYEPQAILIM